MARMINKLPSYQWYTCYPQLVSRICHPNKDIIELLQQILVKVLKEFPHQALWSLMAITKSLTSQRAHRANAVIAKAKQIGTPTDLLDEAEELCSNLLDLCNYPINRGVTNLTLSSNFGHLKRLLRKPLKVIIPLQSALTVMLPPDGKPEKNRRPFSLNPVTIEGMKEEIEIMPSLQKPRKITLRVSLFFQRSN